MYISSLSIVNYKNFKNVTFSFVKDSVNTIIGENASGKTNVFQAMRLVLDESLPSNAKQLQSEDFHRGLRQPFGNWIVIAIEFDDLSNSEEEQVLANYIMNKDKKLEPTGKGMYTFVFRPKFHIRHSLFELTKDLKTKEERKEAFDGFALGQVINRDTYEAIAFVRTNLDFTQEDIYKKHVGDFVEL